MDLPIAPPFPWKVVFSKTALARALSNFFPDVNEDSIELPSWLDEHDPALEEAGVMQTVRTEHCVRVPLLFKDSAGKPFEGALQVAIVQEGGELVLRVEGQPADFRPTSEPAS